jgi:hypothetical protein
MPVREVMGKNNPYLFYSSLLLVAWGILFPAFEVVASDSLVIVGRQILTGENDSVRRHSNAYFLKRIKQIISNDPEMIFSFDSVKNLSVIVSPDRKLRVLSWVLPEMGNKSYTYFGFIQTRSEKKETGIIYELVDKTNLIEDVENAKLTPDNWYGCIYYKILENEISGKKYYTFLGWKGNNQFSTKKLIDALYFIGKRPAFATSLFKVEKKIKNRLILEYNSLAVTSLKYDEDMKMIVFDHLSPTDPKQTGMYENYGPDFSYDGLKFKKGKWELVKDIDLRNDSKKIKKVKKPQHGLIPEKK